MRIETVIKENPNRPPTRSLTARDTCDACGAQALVRVRLAAGILDWCGHHYARHQESLSGAVIEADDRAALDAEEGRA